MGNIFVTLNNLVWSNPIIFLSLGSAILFTILLKGVQNVTLENNDICTDTGSVDAYRAIWLEAAINVKIEGNAFNFTGPTGDYITDGIMANGTYHIYGADVEFMGNSLIPNLRDPAEE